MQYSVLLTFFPPHFARLNGHFGSLDGFRNPALLGVVTDAAHLELTGPTIGRWSDFSLHEFVAADGRRFTNDRLA